jgi:UDP-glucose:(heptosyl)LPS alpha-1,3-glucosyltransferase
LRIALVILHADPSRGGAERYTIDVAAALHKRGYHVSLLASFFADTPDGVTCEKLAADGLTRLGRYESFLDSLDRHLDATPYDVVHAMLPVRRCDLYHPHAGVAAEAIESGHLKHDTRLKRAVARTFNRLNRKRNRFAHVEDDLLTGPEPPIVLCLSEYVKGTVRKHYPGLPADRLAILFNAVDLRKLDPSTNQPRPLPPFQGDAVVALMVAQDFERKGLREAITALASAKEPRLALVVVGKPDPAPYRRLSESLGVADRVHFAGQQSRVVGYYAAADFFVLPTRHDPCSLVVLEALAMGLPVISTKQNGATEIMTPGVHGCVLNTADDLAGLTRDMRELCDRATRERMRAACLELRPRLAYETHLSTLESIYARVRRSDNGARLTPDSEL